MHLQNLISVGQRAVKIKGLRVAVLAVDRFRTALFLVVAAISFCMLAVLSAFTLVTHLAWQTVDGISPYDGVAILCLALLLLAGGLFWAAMSPKRWMRTLGVEALIAAFARETQERAEAHAAANQPAPPDSAISTEDLAELIDRLVQKRVDQALRTSGEAKAASPAKPKAETRPRVAS